jgi:hypothetical protein
MKRVKQRKTDLVALARDYAGKWVAIDPDNRSVVASGTSAKEVLDSAESQGVPVPLVIHVAKDYGELAP